MGLDALRGLAFYAVFYATMAVGGVIFFPAAALSPRAARWCGKFWLSVVFAALRAIGGVRTEIRGPTPAGRVVIAAKHQSMLDVFMIVHALPEGRFVMKRELVRAPIFGWYSMRMGAVPVDRGGGRPALKAMVETVMAGARDGGQIVIYPQGTRVAPGRTAPYKIGVHALYEASGLPCIPAATNSGLRWPKGIALHPGVAVVEFLPAIAPGMAREPFMARIEADIETASARLALERDGSARGDA